MARLHVRAFDMSADRYQVKVGETVRLRITAQLDDRVSQLNNVTLPGLSGFDSLGDERSCFPAPGGGTRCVETLSIAPQQPGTDTIEPATLDAIDARTGRPSRFATNEIVIQVVGDTDALSGWLPALSAVLGTLLRLGGIVVLAGIALAAIAWAFARPRARPAPSAPVAAANAPPPSPPQPVDFGLLVARLSAEPTRERVVAVREAMLRQIGARPEETFADLRARGATGADPHLFAALAAVERAAFCEEQRLSEAVQDALRALSK
ncbi:MAG TPA: BatD family protein [Candidatus Baltobacteraceae bacterium]|nr:BatD family protein [Candidatus Baltobacteraceae bacterium]